METKDIQELMRLASKLGITEFEIEQEDFRLKIKTASDQVQIVREIHTANAPQQMMYAQPAALPAAAPQVAQVAGEPAAQAAAPAAEVQLTTIKAPMVGTFYRSSTPEKDAFVKVGDTITKGQILCVIEAMKLFNEIESEVEGEIVKILIDNATPIEYDQPLFLVK